MGYFSGASPRKQEAAVRRLDAAKAFRLAVEKSAKGELYNVVSDTSIEVKRIAEVIGAVATSYLPGRCELSGQSLK